MSATVSSSLEEQIFAAKRRAEEFTRSLREAREREAKALEALESERLKWGKSISIRDSYTKDDNFNNVNSISSSNTIDNNSSSSNNIISTKEEQKEIIESKDIIDDDDEEEDYDDDIVLDSIKNEENRNIAINSSIDGSIGSFSLMSPNRSFDSTNDHHKDKEKSLQLQVISLEKQVKTLRNELIIANTELRVAKAHTTTLEQRLSEHITSTSNDDEKINLFAKLTTTEAYAKGLENRLQDVDKTYKLQLSSEEELRAVLRGRVAELEKGYIEQKLRADKIEIEASHTIKDSKSQTNEIERLMNANGLLQGQVERSKAEIKRLKMQINGSSDNGANISTLIPTIATTQDSGESQQSLKKWIEEFKNSERYNVDNDAVNIEEGLDTFATSSVLNPDRAFQTFVENIPKPSATVESHHNIITEPPQFKKVKEKKQDVATSPPSLTKLQQPKPQNSKITSPYNLSSLAVKSPINSIFRNINAKVNESLENKNKKSIKVTLPTQSVVSRNVKSSGYGEKKPPAKNPVKQQQAATSRLNKGAASKQPARASHDSSINKGLNISMASSLSLGEGHSNDSMYIDIKKATQRLSTQPITRTSLTKASSIIQKNSTAVNTPTIKRSSSVDARISKTKR